MRTKSNYVETDHSMDVSDRGRDGQNKRTVIEILRFYIKKIIFIMKTSSPILNKPIGAMIPISLRAILRVTFVSE